MDSWYMLQQLKQLGFYDFILPWTFTFSLLLPLLSIVFRRRTEKGMQPIRLVPELLAATISFFVVYYTPAGTSISAFFSRLFGEAISLIAVLFFTAIILSIFTNMTGLVQCPIAPIWALIAGKSVREVLDDCHRKRVFMVIGYLLVASGILLFLRASGTDILPMPDMDLPTTPIRNYIPLLGIFTAIGVVLLLIRKKPGKKKKKPAQAQTQQTP